MSDQSEVFRENLLGSYSAMKGELEKCPGEALDDGEIHGPMDCGALAGFILSSWEGALMEMKLIRSSEPLRIFESMIFDHLLKC